MAGDLKKELIKTLRISLPVVISQVGMFTIGLVDTLVVGRVGPLDIAAVGAASNFFWPLAIVGIGILLGLDTLVSQTFGAGDVKTARKMIPQGLWLAGILSVVGTVLIYFAADFYYLTGASPELLAILVPFLKITAFALPPALLFAALQRYWYGMQVVNPFVAILVVANVANYFADLAFVLGTWGFPKLGATGVAYATLITRWLMLVMAVLVTLALEKRELFRIPWKPNFPMLKQILKIGLPAGGQTGLEVGAFFFTTLLAARLGPMSLAAHHITLSIVAVTFMVPLGLSFAAAVRVGYYIGEGRPQIARQVGWMLIGVGGAFMGLCALFIMLFRETIFGWFTDDVTVTVLGFQVLFFAAIFQVGDGIQIAGTGALRGMGDAKAPFWANLVGHYPIGLVIGVTLAFGMGMGVAGLWAGLMAGLSAVAVLILFRWSRVDWSTISRIDPVAPQSTTSSP